MANQYVRRFLSLVRFCDRFIERLSSALDAHRWLSLCLNLVLSVSAALSGWFDLPASPLHAVASLSVALLVFGCFLADVFFLLLGVDWLFLLASVAAYVTAHSASLAADLAYFLLAMVLGFAACHSALDAAYYLLLVAAGYGLGHRRSIREALQEIFAIRRSGRSARLGLMPPGIARLKVHRSGSSSR